MARPTQAKDPKPKAEGGGDAGANALGGIKGIIINAGLTIVIMAIFTGAIYWMVQDMASKMGTTGTEEVDPHGEEGHGNMSFPYDLEDFIINLHSATDRRYLKVKISLEVERHEGEPEVGAPPAAGGGGHGGHGGGGAVDPKEYYTAIMTPYKMPIRDVIITKISSMSAEELSSTPGKEIAKDLIKEEINTILPEDRQVLRVNFGDFIIQ